MSIGPIVLVVVPPVDALIYSLTLGFPENVTFDTPIKDMGNVSLPAFETALASTIFSDVTPSSISSAYVFIALLLLFCEYLMVRATSNLDGVFRLTVDEIIEKYDVGVFV